MKQAKVLIARSNAEYHIKVEGRANFECSPPLRNFAHSLDCQDCKAIFIDLSECAGMDSTFIKLAPNFSGWGIFFSESGKTNVEIKDMTLDANHPNYDSGIHDKFIYMRFATDLRFEGVRLAVQGYKAVDLHGDRRVTFEGCHHVLL